MSENGEIYTAGKNFILPPAVTASELHCARSFQGYPTRPYLAHSNTGPKNCIWCIMHPHAFLFPWFLLSESYPVFVRILLQRVRVTFTMTTRSVQDNPVMSFFEYILCFLDPSTVDQRESIL